MSKRDILERHQKSGLDPLERALLSERRKLESEDEKVGDYANTVEKLLREHLDTMIETGLAFSHDFQGPKLGLKIVVARYGDKGRRFVEVDAVLPHCEIANKLKVKDELIAINGRLIVEPSEETFEALQREIVAAARPLKLTFIEGEAHASEHDLEDAIFALVSKSHATVASAQAHLDAALLADDSTADVARVEDAVGRADDLAAAVAAKLDADPTATDQAKNARQITLDNLEKVRAFAAQARLLGAKGDVLNPIHPTEAPAAALSTNKKTTMTTVGLVLRSVIVAAAMYLAIAAMYFVIV